MDSLHPRTSGRAEKTEPVTQGKITQEKKLWNGRYCDLRHDETQTDRLDGEWFLRMMGMEDNLPDGMTLAI